MGDMVEMHNDGNKSLDGENNVTPWGFGFSSTDSAIIVTPLRGWRSGYCLDWVESRGDDRIIGG